MAESDVDLLKYMLEVINDQYNDHTILYIFKCYYVDIVIHHDSYINTYIFRWWKSIGTKSKINADWIESQLKEKYPTSTSKITNDSSNAIIVTKWNV